MKIKIIGDTIKMVTYDQFKKIKELQSIGVSQIKIHKKLGISKHHLSKCWMQSEEEFLESQNTPYKRAVQLDNYKEFILDILRVCPQVKLTNILYRLTSEFPDFKVKSNTFFRYVKKLREENGLEKFSKQRITGARERLPMGEEAQVDFGQYKMRTMYGTNVKVYFFCMVLSYSNFRFVHFEPEPFTTKTAIKAHDFAFQYFAGRPKTILYDLDNVFVSSENYGNIVFIKAFEDYIRATGYTARFCHARDPQSKGRVEGLVNLVKHSFLDGRIYFGIDAINAAALAWLDSTGNDTISSLKPYSPRVMFQEERAHLLPVPPLQLERRLYTITSRNTIQYKGNSYELPKGSYLVLTQVRIDIEENKIHIYNPETTELLCTHDIAEGTHCVVKYDDEEQTRLQEEKAIRLFEGDTLFNEYLRRLKIQMPQYLNKQSMALRKVAGYYEREEIQLAFKHCIEVNICHYNELMAFLASKFGKPRAKQFMGKKYSSLARRIKQIEEVYNG